MAGIQHHQILFHSFWAWAKRFQQVSDNAKPKHLSNLKQESSLLTDQMLPCLAVNLQGLQAKKHDISKFERFCQTGQQNIEDCKAHVNKSLVARVLHIHLVLGQKVRNRRAFVKNGLECFDDDLLALLGQGFALEERLQLCLACHRVEEWNHLCLGKLRILANLELIILFDHLHHASLPSWAAMQDTVDRLLFHEQHCLHWNFQGSLTLQRLDASQSGDHKNGFFHFWFDMATKDLQHVWQRDANCFDVASSALVVIQLFDKLTQNLFNQSLCRKVQLLHGSFIQCFADGCPILVLQGFEPAGIQGKQKWLPVLPTCSFLRTCHMVRWVSSWYYLDPGGWEQPSCKKNNKLPKCSSIWWGKYQTGLPTIELPLPQCVLWWLHRIVTPLTITWCPMCWLLPAIFTKHTEQKHFQLSGSKCWCWKSENDVQTSNCSVIFDNHLSGLWYTVYGIRYDCMDCMAMI